MEAVEPGIGDGSDALLRLEGAKRIGFHPGAGGGEGVENGGLPGVGEAHKPEGPAHLRTSSTKDATSAGVRATGTPSFSKRWALA